MNKRTKHRPSYRIRAEMTNMWGSPDHPNFAEIRNRLNKEYLEALEAESNEDSSIENNQKTSCSLKLYHYNHYEN